MKEKDNDFNREEEEGELVSSQEDEKEGMNNDDDGYYENDQNIFSPCNHNDDDDDDDDDNNDIDLLFMNRATLPVAPLDESFDPNQEPTTGEEYLRLVQYEARQMPFTKSVPPLNHYKDENEKLGKSPNHDTTSDSYDDDDLIKIISSTPTHHLPTPEFITLFMKTFQAGCFKFDQNKANDRVDDEEKSVKWPSVDDKQVWFDVFYGQDDDNSNSNAAESNQGKDKKTSSPKRTKSSSNYKRGAIESTLITPTSIKVNPDDIPLLNWSPLLVSRLLTYHIQSWLQPPAPTPRQYQFIIRLLQSLDSHTTSHQVARLRSLARLLLRWRASLSLDTDDLFFINGIIVAISKRFGQIDLLP